MYRQLTRRLARLGPERGLLRQGRKGIEKEGLRVSPDGTIVQTPHPRALGSALTHPYITTDYSEALLELITPPYESVQAIQDFLCDIHRFVYARLGEELVWTTSMPCVVAGDASIPIAEYGSSNSGYMRHVYRRGLAHRYGRVMQVISGVHYNYSLPPAFWPLFQELEGDGSSSRAFVDAQYFALIRNVLRYGWLIVYLFGASPAICNSFLGRRADRFSDFDANTSYEPFATSLRMSDIGYTNRSPAGLRAVYDDLSSYARSLGEAISTPYPPYQAIGVKVDGEYRQLNANILQIENEFYSAVRPKQIAERGEKPTAALRRRGVAYVELRLLDVDPFSPTGISAPRMRFLEAFMLFCLLHESPTIAAQEQRELNDNVAAVAHRGREPGLTLARGGRSVTLSEWAGELLEQIRGVAELLDTPDSPVLAAVDAISTRVREPDATPSARMLAEMRASSSGFFDYAMALSERHRVTLVSDPLSAEREQELEAWSTRSLAEQEELERDDSMTFEDYLTHYFASSDGDDGR